MRRIPLIAAAYGLFISGPAFAQEWIEYASQQDFFTVNFPNQPQVQEITYATESGSTLPARVYSAADGGNRYSVTVVDYTGPAKIIAGLPKKWCQAGDAYPDVCRDATKLSSPALVYPWVEL